MHWNNSNNTLFFSAYCKPHVYLRICVFIQFVIPEYLKFDCLFKNQIILIKVFIVNYILISLFRASVVYYEQGYQYSLFWKNINSCHINSHSYYILTSSCIYVRIKFIQENILEKKVVDWCEGWFGFFHFFFVNYPKFYLLFPKQNL